MKNLEIARILYEIADILEIKNVQWKPAAYGKAARSIESLSEDIESIYKKKGKKGLDEIPGVGEGIAEKIAEYLETGKIKELENLRKKIPKGLTEIMKVQGMGPKKAAKLYKKLGIKSVKELEKAAKKGKIRKIATFGEKSEEDILLGTGMVRKGKERKQLGVILPIAEEIAGKLKLKSVKRLDIAGSIRRKKETIRDIDILIVAEKPKEVMDKFTTLDNVKRVLAKGTTKAAILLKEGIAVDIRIIPEKSYGAALNYFTGSKDHNIKLRQIAIKKGWKLSEYGLFRKKGKIETYIAGKTEQELYKKLGMRYIEPEMRENTGEIELAIKNKLPKLISYDAIKGDLHIHTKWSDGNNTTEEMIKAAMQMKYKYIALTDHSKSTRIANGLDEKTLIKKLKEIDTLRKKYRTITIFKSAEVDILPNGKLDYSDETLKKLDFVIASIHSRFKSTKEMMTSRIIKAIENKHVNAIAHPTGRLINKRQPYQVNLDKIFQAAKDHDVALEINAFPSRLDLHDIDVKRALEYKVKLIINTDAHSVAHLQFMKFGIAQARRGWATEKDVLNTFPLNKFKKMIKK